MAPPTAESSCVQNIITQLTVVLITSVVVIGLADGQMFQRQATADPPDYCKSSVTGTGSNTPFRPNPSRVFPFCVGKDPKTDKWEPVLVQTGFPAFLDDIDDVQKQAGKKYDGFKYVPENHHMYGQDTNPIIQVEMFPHQLRHDYPKGQINLMDYWMVFEFRGLFYDHPREETIHGIYLQGIQGPLGLPFGEFINLKHQSKSVLPLTGVTQEVPYEGFHDEALYYPCTYYAKAGPVIPNVFIWSSQRKNSGTLKRRTRFNVTFRWADPPCAEVPFFQFLIVVVYKWNRPGGGIGNYRALLSPIFLPGRMSFNFDQGGVPYPYFPDWSYAEISTYWHQTEVDFAKITSGYNWLDYRIISNRDYENCVMHKVGLEKSGPSKGACPPGPFKCTPKATRDPQRAERLWSIWSNLYLDYNANLGRPACPPPPDPTTTMAPATNSTDNTTSTTEMSTSTTPTGPTTTEEPPPPTTTTTERPPTAVDNQTKVVAKIAKRVEEQKVISHGDLCTFVWFVLIPSANFLARYFQDFANWQGIGVGLWIVAHVLIHHIGVLLMWISFGLVVSNGVSFLGGASGTHYLFGFPATLIQHYELFSGFVRNKKLQNAQRQSIVHAVNGYISGFLSMFCAYNSHIDTIKWWSVVGLFAVDVVGNVAGTMLELRIAKQLGLYPGRKVFPVMERVMMVNAKPRQMKHKISMTLLYLLLKLGLYILYLFHGQVR